ncbi:MAG: hypothetical protein WD032_04960 [Nitrospirales bacterium]
MLIKRGNVCQVSYAKRLLCRMMFQSLGGILFGFLIVASVYGEVKKITPNHLGSGEKAVQRIHSRNDLSKRRDPFKPIKKRRALSSRPRQSSPAPPQLPSNPAMISPWTYPNWKLLGIIHGQIGRQAVIQISPKARVFVLPGLEVGRSGWILKTISREEVLLEYPSSSVESFQQPKVFILSFSTLGKPS